MSDHSELKRLAKSMKGWDKMSECWPCDENGPDWHVGRLDEDDNRWPLLTVDSEQYDQEQDAPMIAQYYAAANPSAVLALIAEVEALRKDAEQWKTVQSAIDQLQSDERNGSIWTVSARLLISVAHKLNSSISTVTEEGVTIGDNEVGDWRVTVERIDTAMTKGDQP